MNVRHVFIASLLSIVIGDLVSAQVPTCTVTSALYKVRVPNPSAKLGGMYANTPGFDRPGCVPVQLADASTVALTSLATVASVITVLDNMIDDSMDRTLSYTSANPASMHAATNAGTDAINIPSLQSSLSNMTVSTIGSGSGVNSTQTLADIINRVPSNVHVLLNPDEPGNVSIGAIPKLTERSVMPHTNNRTAVNLAEAAGAKPFGLNTSNKVDRLAALTAQSLSAFTPGSVLFGGPDGSIAQDNLNFFWDNTAKTLNIRTISDFPVKLKQSGAEAPVEIAVSYNVFAGVNDDLFNWQYNRDGSATDQPIWGENFESRYVPGAPPGGLLERHFNYTSIDRAVSYRPWNFDVNLNTNDAEVLWRVLEYSISSRTESDIYFFHTGTSGVANFRRPLYIQNDFPQLSLSTADQNYKTTFYTNSFLNFGELVIQTLKLTGPGGAFMDYAFMTLRAKALGVSAAGTTAPAGMYLQSGNNPSGTNVGLRLDRNTDVLQIVDAGTTLNPTGWQFSRVKLATPFLGVGTVSNLTERIVMPNSGFLGSVDAAGTSTIKLIGLNASDTIRMDFDRQNSVGPTGAASPLPPNPAGYIVIDIQGTEYAMPFYFK